MSANSWSLPPLEAIYATVSQAVTTKRPLAVQYDGKPTRFLCPHVLGLNKKGEYQALCYQYAGYSSSGIEPDGSPSNWRCLPLHKITSIQFCDGGEWHTAPNHSRPQSCVKEVHIEVAF